MGSFYMIVKITETCMRYPTYNEYFQQHTQISLAFTRALIEQPGRLRVKISPYPDKTQTRTFPYQTRNGHPLETGCLANLCCIFA